MDHPRLKAANIRMGNGIKKRGGQLLHHNLLRYKTDNFTIIAIANITTGRHYSKFFIDVNTIR